MNTLQRAALIAAGIAIALFQVRGIADDGIANNPGWAISFFISALLLVVGFASQEQLRGVLSRFAKPQAQNRVVDQRIASAKQGSVATEEQTVRRNREYGVHVSEMDIAIEAMIIYAKDHSLWHPLEGNGKTLRWNASLCVYASMRYAARTTGLTVHATVWNSIKHAIENRMMEDEDNRKTSHRQDAMSDMSAIEKAVEAALNVKGSYKLEPIVTAMAFMFGTQHDGVKPLAAIILICAGNADEKIIPELLETFS
jgi:hypothetical protein